jgi:hypothetical protein
MLAIEMGLGLRVLCRGARSIVVLRCIRRGVIATQRHLIATGFDA